ncbi:MAG TPA: hypothetical protein VKT77_18855 [Chthonomonadaceae bacterium]|nr:hypothetical protein [Chthonomonadaceae bacterium]
MPRNSWTAARPGVRAGRLRWEVVLPDDFEQQERLKFGVAATLSKQ